jgi:PAS domain S-box-containing protein
MQREVVKDETGRLDALKSYRVLDTLPDAKFDALSKLAAQICGVEAAFISVMEEDRQWFKSQYGVELSELPREVAMCNYTLQHQGQVYVVEDASKDSRFQGNPLVLGEPRVCFYAGVALVDPNGFALGTLCVIDSKPQHISPAQKEGLQTLASSVMNLLEIRKQDYFTSRDKLTVGKALDFTKSFFFVLTPTAEIERFGGHVEQFSPELRVGDSFFDHYEFLNPFNFFSFYESTSKETQSIAFFQSKNKAQRFRFSAQRHRNFVVVMFKPLVNINFPIANYNLTLRDFPPEDYISEFLFLQQTSNRYLKESHDMISDLRQKNKDLRNAQTELDLIARFPKENPNPIVRIDYNYHVSFSNNAASHHFLADFDFVDGKLLDAELVQQISHLISFGKDTEAFTMVRNARTYSIGIRRIPHYEYVNIYATDITYYTEMLSKQEEQNIKQKNFYHFILNNIPADIAVFDHEHKYLFVNPNGIKDKDLREFIIGKDDFDYCRYKNLSNDVAVNRRQRFMSVKESNKVSEWVDQHVNANGEEKYVLRKFFPVSDEGQFKYVIGYGVDVTAIKAAEHQLLKSAEEARESELKYKTLVETTYEIVQSVGLDGSFLFVNNAWHKTFGYTPEELSGLTIMDLIDPENLQECMVHFQSVIEGNSLEEVSVIFRTKSGEKIYSVGSASPRIKDGEIVGTNGFFQNVTEIKKREDEILEFNSNLEEKVKQRTLQLESALKELDSFSYSVSHDLRSPLRAIDGWSLALMEDYSDRLDEQGLKCIDRMRSESQRMGSLIDDLLNLSRVGRRELKIGKVDLSLIASNIFERILEVSERKDIIFKAPDSLIALGDSNLLDIMLTNLISNAVKFSSKVEKPEIELGMNKVGDLFVYYIKDNGAGFNMNNASKLFGAFQRMHRQSDFAGTGIGLAIVQRIVRAHGGEVWAESEQDKGATFFFYLRQKQVQWN